MPATDTYWRNLKKMHVVFVLSAIGLLVVTLGMMWADHNDEWRGYQSTFDLIEETRLERQIEADRTEEYQARLDELEQKLQAAEDKYEDDKDDVEDEIENLAYQLDLAERELRAQRAFRDKARADYDLAVRDNRTRAAEDLKEKFDEEQAKVDALELKVQNLNTELAQAKDRQEELKDDVIAIESEIAAMKKEVERLEATKNRIAPDNTFSAIKRKVMQWPIIDGFNSPHQIKQVWLPDMKITLGMASTARFDRCQTCHLGIDRVETGNIPSFPHSEGEDFVPTAHASEEDVKRWVDANKYPHPYATHPNPDLYLSATSPHPTQEFGCTICHDGQGSGTSFDNVQHTPNHPVQHEHWEDKYHYHPNHFWEYPMQPERFRESTCLKCHHNVVELETSPKFGNSAPKLVEGFHTIQEYGCFGCHEIHGQDGADSIGPDLRLEPNYFAVALEMAAASKRKLAETASSEANGDARRLNRILNLANQVASAPEDAESERRELQQLVQADVGLEKPLFDARTHALAEDLKDTDNPGKYRKVGPSLRYVDKKTTQGWLEYWTIEPKRFRPSTRMPQFFHLTNQEDETAEAYQPVQVSAISHYLLSKSKSQPLELESPKEGYEPNAERGKELFSERGCLSCHSHKDFPEIEMDVGPRLDKVHAKLKPGEEGFNWLYSWIRDPHRYNKRTIMPNLFLRPEDEKGYGEELPEGAEAREDIDAAADIAAYLLQEREQSPAEYEVYEIETYDVVVLGTGDTPQSVASLVAGANGLDEAEAVRRLGTLPQTIVEDVPKSEADALAEQLKSAGAEVEVMSDLDRLVRLFLAQALTINQMEDLGKTRLYPYKPEEVKGDEIELVYEGEGEPSEDDWQAMKLNYVGRRTISQYGCYGCHDIPGFEAAKPIGTALQDWGRKDTSRLAFEHINEFLEHHSTPGSDEPVAEQAKDAVKRAKAEEFKTEEARESALSEAFYYDSILHHGRPGFIWQKLRQPRSYDYKKTETKRYDERLRMPKFPLDENQVEAVTTFVLGLTAEPPAERYLFKPKGAELARYEGEFLLHKYNCANCHMLDLPEVQFSIQPRKSQDDVVEWMVENRQPLVSGELGYSVRVPAPGEEADSKYESFPPAYRQIHRKAAEEAGTGLVELANEANKAYGGETEDENEQQQKELAYRAVVNDFFDEHPQVLAATYADAITDPGSRDSGMTREQIVNWFVENRRLLVAGGLKKYPADIQTVNDLAKYFGMDIDVVGIAKLANVNLENMSEDQIDRAFQTNVSTWFENHPEVLLTAVPGEGKFPDGVRSLFKVKPPVSGTTSLSSDTGDAVLRFHGTGLFSNEEYSYDLWDTLDVDGRVLLPTSKMLFTPEQVVSINEGRGGDFAEWLTLKLADVTKEDIADGAFDAVKIGKGRQSAPPPLNLEGLKVQTPWLFQFLKNPDRIRNETVLRMPRFNMSDAEARALANYFAAVDDADYPYQDIPQQESGYGELMNSVYRSEFPEEAEEEPDYLSRSWMMFGKYQLCRQCHSIAGHPLQVADPKQLTHGPDLDTRVANRFRPDYLEAWLHSPQWVLPYTAMIGPTGDPLAGYFNKEPSEQVEALRDAMLNYNKLLQKEGKIEPPPPAKAPAAGTATQ